jgi:hypothetical protein
MITEELIENNLIYFEILVILCVFRYSNNIELDKNVVYIMALIFFGFCIHKIFFRKNIHLIKMNINDKSKLKEIFGNNYFDLNDKEKINKWKKYLQDEYEKYGDDCVFDFIGYSYDHMFIQIKLILQQWKYNVEIEKYLFENKQCYNLCAWNKSKHNIIIENHQ